MTIDKKIFHRDRAAGVKIINFCQLYYFYRGMNPELPSRSPAFRQTPGCLHKKGRLCDSLGMMGLSVCDVCVF